MGYIRFVEYMVWNFLPMTKSFTLIYLFSNTETYPSEVVFDDLNASPGESAHEDVFAYFDKHLAEVSEHVVEKLLQYASGLPETNS